MKIKVGDIVTTKIIVPTGTKRVFGLVTRVYLEPHWLDKEKIMDVCEFKTLEAGKIELYYMHYLEKV